MFACVYACVCTHVCVRVRVCACVCARACVYGCVVSEGVCAQANGSKDGPMYDLYGVLVHRGESVQCGHYFSFVKHKDNQWIKLDDDQCSPVPPSKVLEQDAYMLFYSRRVARTESLVSQASQVAAPRPEQNQLDPEDAPVFKLPETSATRPGEMRWVCVCVCVCVRERERERERERDRQRHTQTARERERERERGRERESVCVRVKYEMVSVLLAGEESEEGVKTGRDHDGDGHIGEASGRAVRKRAPRVLTNVAELGGNKKCRTGAGACKAAPDQSPLCQCVA
jgi:hypothetical protein